MNILVEIFGWVGMILMLVAYWLISDKQINARSKLYQIMMLSGSIGIMINGFYHRAVPVIALNIVFSIIAIWTLISMQKRSN